jgi:hypothetical protein
MVGTQTGLKVVLTWENSRDGPSGPCYYASL